MNGEINRQPQELSDEELAAICGGDFERARRAYKLADHYCKTCDRSSSCNASVAKLTRYIFQGGGDIYAYYRCPYYGEAGGE